MDIDKVKQMLRTTVTTRKPVSAPEESRDLLEQNRLDQPLETRKDRRGIPNYIKSDFFAVAAEEQAIPVLRKPKTKKSLSRVPWQTEEVEEVVKYEKPYDPLQPIKKQLDPFQPSPPKPQPHQQSSQNSYHAIHSHSNLQSNVQIIAPPTQQLQNTYVKSVNQEMQGAISEIRKIIVRDYLNLGCPTSKLRIRSIVPLRISSISQP